MKGGGVPTDAENSASSQVSREPGFFWRLKLCSQLARVRLKPCVCAYFAGFGGIVRTETRRNGNSNMLEFSARIRRVTAYMPVTLTGGVKKLVLEGVGRMP